MSKAIEVFDNLERICKQYNIFPVRSESGFYVIPIGSDNSWKDARFVPVPESLYLSVTKKLKEEPFNLYQIKEHQYPPHEFHSIGKKVLDIRTGNICLCGENSWIGIDELLISKKYEKAKELADFLLKEFHVIDKSIFSLII